MGVLIYTTTKFNEPGLISIEMYNEMKQKFNENSGYSLFLEYESFHDIMKNYYLWMIISCVGVIIGSLGDNEGVTVAIGGIGFLSFIFSIVYYLLEAPSRSKFVKERNQFLKKLEDVIKASSDYEDFTRFYKMYEFGMFSKSYILTRKRQR